MKTLISDNIDLAIKLSNDLNLRFNLTNNAILGTHYKNTAENTISRLLLPLCQKIKFQKVFILGFDGMPGRFYSDKYPANEKGERLYKQKTSPYVSQFNNLNRWNDWTSYTNMEIYSVLPGPINNHIKYMDFETALKIDNETNN